MRQDIHTFAELHQVQRYQVARDYAYDSLQFQAREEAEVFEGRKRATINFLLDRES